MKEPLTGAPAASSPEPLEPQQAVEEAEIGYDASNDYDKSGRASQSCPGEHMDGEEEGAEPEIMVMDREEDDGVEFVSETGPGIVPSSSAAVPLR